MSVTLHEMATLITIRDHSAIADAIIEILETEGQDAVAAMEWDIHKRYGKEMGRVFCEHSYDRVIPWVEFRGVM